MSQSDKYQVKLGHIELTVEADTAADALQRARKRLRDQLPRLWDVITSLSDDRFEVALVNSAR